MSATSSVANGATVTGYVYTIKKDGVVVKTETIKSNKTTDSYTYTTKAQGSYTVELTVKTSLGDKTDSKLRKNIQSLPQRCVHKIQSSQKIVQSVSLVQAIRPWIKDEKMFSKCCTDQNSGKYYLWQRQRLNDNRQSLRQDYVHSLEVVNRGKAPANDIVEDLSDITDHASVTETGGGTYNADKKL